MLGECVSLIGWGYAREVSIGVVHISPRFLDDLNDSRFHREHEHFLVSLDAFRSRLESVLTRSSYTCVGGLRFFLVSHVDVDVGLKIGAFNSHGGEERVK
jgi:hypothetical protein